jgi:hypothetical protein
MPDGKPAGVRCAHLADDMSCRLFGDSRRPLLCHEFAAERALCGDNRAEALQRLQMLEVSSAPDGENL